MNILTRGGNKGYAGLLIQPDGPTDLPAKTPVDACLGVRGADRAC